MVDPSQTSSVPSTSTPAPQSGAATGSGGWGTSLVLRIGEDKSQEPKWLSEGPQGLFGAHWYFTVIFVVTILIGLILAGFDAWVGYNHGLMLLDLTLEAQAEAVVAIIAVIAGGYATMRALRPAAKSG
jgi:hypothetical protein